MKRAKTLTLRRPTMSSPRPATTAKEAAIDLVRLEFDAERLELGISQARDRLNSYQTELDRLAAKRARLTRIIKE